MSKSRYDIIRKMTYGEGDTPETKFCKEYLALKYKLGYLYLLPGQESLGSILGKFAAKALRSFAHGLGSLVSVVFKGVRNIGEKSVFKYKDLLGIWKTRVWKQARYVDGNKFDNYMVKVPPYKILNDRVMAIATIHQAIGNINTIFNESVAQGNYWLTSDCQKAINAMAKIGYNARHHDMMIDGVSAAYKRAAIRQSMYLHKYTLKNIMSLLDKMSKIIDYADPTYLQELEEKLNILIDKVNDQEGEILSDRIDNDDDKKISPKQTVEKEYNIKMRAARLWWMTHFVRSAYIVTLDVVNDLEKLVKATENCISTED